ncbi:hypothetical protein QFZ77_002911 [Paenibacillus sp. V4I3]|uniref:hypothetical protein n=1 Tax=Paenibacillus sp. V4I3 TaxID=3042305 RepID=UPI00277FD8DD|nr:hypothetical protein [Paenibacillus sp. V4I3]MDQ0874252.1 hypothetical protein [Paenibacillus sp. V4I3]
MRKSSFIVSAVIFAGVLIAIAIFAKEPINITQSISIGVENTDHDLNELERMNMKFETPTTQPKINATLAIENAEKTFGTMSKDIHVEYQLITSPFRLFSDEAITKNPDLKKNGIEKLQAYIISFRGLNIPSSGPKLDILNNAPVEQQEHRKSNNEFNVVVDATTGVTIEAFSYR